MVIIGKMLPVALWVIVSLLGAAYNRKPVAEMAISRGKKTDNER